MSWKEWPYWLRGGLIGLGITILLSLYVFLKAFSEFFLILSIISSIAAFTIGAMIGKIIEMKNLLIKGILLGCMLGALIWLYDFDFLLNAGGPSTPISDSVVGFFNLNRYEPFTPLFLLIVIMGVFGALIGLAIGKITSKQ